MRFALIALLLATAAAASEDFTVVSKNTLNGNPSENTTNYLSDNRARMEQRGHDMIIDLTSGTMTILDSRKKTYYTVTKADLDELKARMQEKLSTPEAKKGMEAMQGMSSVMASSIEVKKTGNSRKVGSYSCDEWEITMNAMTTMKECVTSEVKYPAHAYEAFRKLSASMSAMNPFAPAPKPGESLGEKMAAIKGYPVATSMVIDVMGNKTTTQSEVISISRAPIPASTWEVPAGYTKVENPMKKAFEGHGGHD
jgi:Domain of unknown function (DUF4412)